MKLLMTLYLILIFGISDAQDFSFPTLNQSGQSISDFVPGGWSVLDSAFGDLNNDKLNDIAFVIQHRDSVTLSRSDGGYSDKIITQPRVLILVFYNAKTKNYDLIEHSNSIILNHDNPNMDEPFQDISISGGILKIDFSIFMNTGGWSMSNNAYKFRYQLNQFYLIGADCNTTNRSSGETENRSYNFITKKVKVETGNISSEKQKIISRVFKLKELKTFKTFTEPFTWEVEKDYYL